RNSISAGRSKGMARSLAGMRHHRREVRARDGPTGLVLVSEEIDTAIENDAGARHRQRAAEPERAVRERQGYESSVLVGGAEMCGVLNCLSRRDERPGLCEAQGPSLAQRHGGPLDVGCISNSGPPSVSSAGESCNEHPGARRLRPRTVDRSITETKSGGRKL